MLFTLLFLDFGNILNSIFKNNLILLIKPNKKEVMNYDTILVY